jgi:hypothetical protein
MDRETKTAFSTLTRTIERGFAAVSSDIADIKGDITNIKGDVTNIKGDITEIKSTMATKEDIAGILLELVDIKKRLKAVEKAVEDHTGYTKEIDHAFERITVIERHLGIKVKSQLSR